MDSVEEQRGKERGGLEQKNKKEVIVIRYTQCKEKDRSKIDTCMDRVERVKSLNK